MLNFHQSFGSGKADVCASSLTMTPSDIAIYKESKALLDDPRESLSLDGWNEWLGTLSKAELDEYWANEELRHETEDVNEEDELKKKSELFQMTHGVNRCKCCKFWSQSFDGYCSECEKFVRANGIACKRFNCMTDSVEILSGAKVDHEAYRARTNHAIALSLAEEVRDTKKYRLVRDTIAIWGVQRIEDIYSQFASEFAKTPYKTFAAFKAAFVDPMVNDGKEVRE